MQFIFWNTGRKNVYPHLARLMSIGDVVVGLAEVTFPDSYIEDRLNATAPGRRRLTVLHHLDIPKSGRLVLLSSLPARMVAVRDSGQRVVMVEAHPPGLRPILVVILHLPSMLHTGEPERAELARRHAQRIEAIETAAGHERTLVMGDFNMLPFEPGMLGFGAFNTVLYLDVLERTEGRRTLYGKARRVFYNPILHLAGQHPPATYHHAGAKDSQPFWHQLDQVLLRPALVPHFDHRSLRIGVDGDGDGLLTSRGLPNAAIADHLPLMFTLDPPLETTP